MCIAKIPSEMLGKLNERNPMKRINNIMINNVLCLSGSTLNVGGSLTQRRRFTAGITQPSDGCG